jgi:hypothetical protein
MVNEALAKILAHNVCCCIAAWYELGTVLPIGIGRRA